MSLDKMALQRDPAGESFDWTTLGQGTLHQAEMAAFDAFRKWDPQAQYVPAARWQAATRAALSVYYKTLVAAGWIRPPDF